MAPVFHFVHGVKLNLLYSKRDEDHSGVKLTPEREGTCHVSRNQRTEF